MWSKKGCKKIKARDQRGRGERVALSFLSLSLLRTALHYLNTWNRLGLGNRSGPRWSGILCRTVQHVYEVSACIVNRRGSSGFQPKKSIPDGFGALCLICFWFPGGWSPVSLESPFLDCHDHVITWVTWSVINIVGALLSSILLKMTIISCRSEAVCCAMVEFQIELFEASTRCKTGCRTKMLDPLSVAFIAFFEELRKRAYKYNLAKTLFQILIPHGESL